MKKLLLALCLFIPFIAAANVTDTVITINRLPETGYLLNKGWKFHTGDNLAYAQTNYDDRSWQSINPALNIPQLPAPAQQGIGWLRIKLNISPDLKHTAGIRIGQTPAVEIYLNGKLVGKRGIINNQLKTGIGYINVSEAIELQLTNAPVQVLAVRYAYQPAFKYFNRNFLPSLAKISFVNTQQQYNFINRLKNDEFFYIIVISMLLLLSVFGLTLWQHNKINTAYLFFTGTCFLISLAFTGFFFRHYKPSLNVYVGTYLTGNFFLLAAYLLIIKFLCQSFKFRTGFYFLLLSVVGISVFSIEYFCEIVKYDYSIALNLMILVAFVVIIKAVFYKRRGALIIAAGCLIDYIGTFYNIYLATHSSFSPIPILIANLIVWLGPILGITMYLAREYALDARLLAVKLVEVEELSAVNLAQEREKQHLLANQNELLEGQVKKRTSELNQSLTNLKQTQNQLIQSEKMASLGELTAGIAHEIQNPLNFVNNFSEVSIEMLEEMEEEMEKGDVKEASVIATDIKQNLEKINHHGKRADFIVKGMLQHSRTNTGEKQLTNINTLADEFLKLSYLGIRTKDKSFNAELVTDFDDNLPKINVGQQDIGRVLLNLFNNAFYAVHQKQKTAEAGYKPEVTVDTSFTDTFLVIKVKDNGIGIPEEVKDKILQPFFTTKPTGEGTGLGLSLSYDIVVKVHGGKIDVESKEGEGSRFIINLPLSV